jgi:hypothetical protein
MRVDPNKLLEVLRATYPQTDPFDLSAALYALAAVETGFDADARGDGGESVGVFQVNLPTWPALRYAPPAGVGDDRISYEVSFIAPVVKDLFERMGAISAALVSVGRTSVDGTKVHLWPSLAWQLAPATLDSAVRDSRSEDPYDWIDSVWPLGSDPRTRNAERHRVSTYHVDYESVARAGGTDTLVISLRELAERLARIALVAGAIAAASEGFGVVLGLGVLAWLGAKFLSRGK